MFSTRRKKISKQFKVIIIKVKKKISSKPKIIQSSKRISLINKKTHIKSINKQKKIKSNKGEEQKKNRKNRKRKWKKKNDKMRKKEIDLKHQIELNWIERIIANWMKKTKKQNEN